MLELPRLLPDFPLISGRLKADYTDFLVEEVPLYPCDGTGTHTYFLLEKAGLSTHQAVYDIAKALNVPRRDIGFAGLKDSRAVTRQWMSLEHVPPEQIAAINIPRLRVVETNRHGNKLKIGHLKGNRFTIRVRDVDTDRGADLRQALEQLSQRGVPNYFGEQRFGYRGDTWQIGRAIVQGSFLEALDFVLGRPGPQDHGDVLRARRLYEAGQYWDAYQAWPHMFRSERQALKAIARDKGKRRRGFFAIDQATRNFYVSAYQSYLFNQVIALRMPQGLHILQNGDLAWLHANGAVFRVPEAATEQPRAERFDISPTGPIFGYRMTQPEGLPAEVETRVLSEDGTALENFREHRLHAKGSRRPLRFPLHEVNVELGADQRGPYLEFRFMLPRGCYATTLLRELFVPEALNAVDEQDRGTEPQA